MWQIRRGGQSNRWFFRGNIYGRWNQVKGIMGSFIRAGTIINGNGRDIQSRANTISWKAIIEAAIKRPVVVLSC